MSMVHKCGAVLTDNDEACPRCGRPILRIPEKIFNLTAEVNQWTGLDRQRISLLGIISSVYMAGWDDCMERLTAFYEGAKEGER